MTKRFHKLNSRWVDIEEPVIYDTFEQKALNIEQSVELLNEQQATITKLKEENEQLRQKLKTICNTCCYDCEEQWCEK